jgi:hypothetical protein
MAAEPYVCGPLMTEGAHRIGVNLLRSSLSETKAHMFTRFLECWCYEQCMGDWRIEQSHAALLIVFDNDRDCVLFKLTPEWDYLRDNGPLDD